jgi:hypothetical protein
METLIDAMTYCYRRFWVAYCNDEEIAEYYWRGYRTLREKLLDLLAAK